MFNKDKEKLYVLVNLRRIGWANTSLASLFGVHEWTIRDQLKTYGISKQEITFGTKGIINKILSRWNIVNGERITRGKTYIQYLKEQ